MKNYVEVRANSKVTVKKGTNTSSPYNHQKDAMLNIIDQEKSFSTWLYYHWCGKTYTAST